MAGGWGLYRAGAQRLDLFTEAFAAWWGKRLVLWGGDATFVASLTLAIVDGWARCPSGAGSSARLIGLEWETEC